MPSLPRVIALAVSIPIALVACDLFAPSVLTFDETVRNQTYSVRLPIIGLTLPSATGRPTIEYSLEPEVPGLRFDPRTRVLSGTPTTAGVYAMTYTARSPTEDVFGMLTFSIRLVEIGKSKETATQILQGSPIRGRFADDDEVHYFRVHVPSTVHLIAATDRNPIYGSTLVAIERDGNVGSDDDHIDGVEDAQPGTYYVRVKRHPYSRGGSYEYALAVWLVGSDNATFDIEIRYVSDLKPTSADRTAIHRAVEYWQKALGENDNTKGRIVLRSGHECNGVSPVFGDYVDDVLIHFTVEQIDSAGRGWSLFPTSEPTVSPIYRAGNNGYRPTHASPYGHARNSSCTGLHGWHLDPVGVYARSCHGRIERAIPGYPLLRPASHPGIQRGGWSAL